MDVTVAPDSSCGVGRRLSGGNNAAGTVARSGAPRVRSGQDGSSSRALPPDESCVRCRAFGSDSHGGGNLCRLVVSYSV